MVVRASCCSATVGNFLNCACKIACHVGCRSSFGFIDARCLASKEPIIFRWLMAALGLQAESSRPHADHQVAER